MKNLLTAAVLALSIAGFTACSDNDDKDLGPSPHQTGKIEGEWKGITTESTSRDANGNMLGAVKVEDHPTLNVTFSGSSITAVMPGRSSSGTYTMNGNILNMQVSVNPFAPNGEYVIDTLNAHRLVMYLKGGYSNNLGGKTTFTIRSNR